MDDPTDTSAVRWSASPSAKEKNAVQRAVTALLDELAPERVLGRGPQLRGPVEQHRTPSGCVLQAATAALSVSWFPDTGADTGFGELHVLVWRGTVSRRGSAQRPDAASMVSELVLYPIERPTSDFLWRTSSGTEYDTSGLAAHCVQLLEDQIRADPGAESAE